MMQFTFLRFLGDTLLSYEQLNESSSSVNISTDTCIEATIEENDDLFSQLSLLSSKTPTAKNSTEENNTI